MFSSRATVINHVLAPIGALHTVTTAPTATTAWRNSPVPNIDRRWRPALDPQVYTLDPHDIPGLIAVCRAVWVLAAGAHGQLCRLDLSQWLRPDALILPSHGRYPHLHNPEVLWPVLAGLLHATARRRT